MSFNVEESVALRLCIYSDVQEERVHAQADFETHQTVYVHARQPSARTRTSLV